MPTHYEILGLTPDDSTADVTAHWREAVKRLRDVEGNVGAFSALVAARDVLSDPVKRAEYDFRQATQGLKAIHCVAETHLPRLQQHFGYWNFCALPFEGNAVFDKETFFQAAYERLPNPYGYTSGDSWDAFEDVLTDGLSLLRQRYIALLWTDAHNMLQRGLPVLLEACSVFEDISRQLLKAKERKFFTVILSGHGANFVDAPLSR